MVERFETRKLVDRAKGLLNEKMGLTEPEAFRWIQKASMDRRLTMQDVAKAIIEQLAPQEVARPPLDRAARSLSRRTMRPSVVTVRGASLDAWFVMRTVEQRRPCSSVTTISCTVMLRPRWIGVQTPVTRPSVAERVWVALMSTPTASRPGPACRFARHRAERFAEHDVGAAVQEPDGLRVALDGHRGDASARRENSTNSMPIFSASAPHPACGRPIRAGPAGIGHVAVLMSASVGPGDCRTAR